MEKASNTGWVLLAGLAALVIGGSLFANHKTSNANDRSTGGDSTVKIIGGEITFN